MNEYIGGKKIETTVVEFSTQRGAKIELSMLHNARLATNGYLPSARHEICLRVNGDRMRFCGEQDTAEFGYAIMANMRSCTIPVPAASQDAVKAMIDAYLAANAAADAAAAKVDTEYRSHVAAVENMMTLNGRSK